MSDVKALAERLNSHATLGSATSHISMSMDCRNASDTLIALEAEVERLKVLAEQEGQEATSFRYQRDASDARAEAAESALAAVRKVDGCDVEGAARTLYLRHKGSNPDWPVGLDHQGHHQEPYVSYVPGWKWFYEEDAHAALAVGCAPLRAKYEAAIAAIEAALPQAEGCLANHYGDNPEGCSEPQHIALMRAALAALDRSATSKGADDGR